MKSLWNAQLRSNRKTSQITVPQARALKTMPTSITPQWPLPRYQPHIMKQSPASTWNVSGILPCEAANDLRVDPPHQTPIPEQA
ncbi:MAG: hypothetical protein ACOX18_04810 [Bacillota bacterium]